MTPKYDQLSSAIRNSVITKLVQRTQLWEPLLQRILQIQCVLSGFYESFASIMSIRISLEFKLRNMSIDNWGGYLSAIGKLFRERISQVVETDNRWTLSMQYGVKSHDFVENDSNTILNCFSPVSLPPSNSHRFLMTKQTFYIIKLLGGSEWYIGH